MKSRLPKVLHVFDELQPSGGELMLASASSLWTSHTEAHVLSTGRTIGIYGTNLETAGYTIHHLAFAKCVAFFGRFGRFVRREQFDVIHLHSERAALWYALTVRLAVGYAPAVIRTVHHLFAFRGWLRLRKLLERHIMRRLLRVTLVSNSPSGWRNEARRFRVANELIPNWYDHHHYVPEKDGERSRLRSQLGFPESTCVFVSLGGNEPYKNYHMIVEALALVPAELKILYVQLGRQGQGRPLEAAAGALGVSNRLRCLGVVPDPLPYLQAADAFLMPSAVEGFGVAAVEAMATGLPVILSDVEALSDFRRKFPGITYIAPTPRAIASAMETMALMSSRERRSLGGQTAALTRQHYGLDRGPQQYLALYAQRLSNPRASSSP